MCGIPAKVPLVLCRLSLENTRMFILTGSCNLRQHFRPERTYDDAVAHLL